MNKISPKIFYSHEYNIRFLGFEKLYPFDGCKYEKVWASLINEPQIKNFLYSLNNSDLTGIDSKILLVHDHSYINRLHDPDYIAKILELPDFPLRSYLLRGLDVIGLSLQNAVLKPMKWAVAGTIKAAYEALNCGIAVNLSGGYHHARKNSGEGFCVYSDIAIALKELKISRLQSQDKVLIIDLDAHQGNGLERIFLEDESVYIFDMYNKDIYPQDEYALRNLNLHQVPLKFSTDGKTYLSRLKDELPNFLDNLGSSQPKIAFYNAGTDVYENDPLGGLKLTKKEVLQRDMYVFNTLTERKIPWVMVLSGGYTPDSHIMVTNSIKKIKDIAERYS
ncbi:MAG: histone deacetylase [Chlorogloeopsis fritschii C42_A2020_084]|uniref:histone deacetylase family protein n=1 Tax=Chlorogloeopsis fritschii TaxID=1124 RepID=UPI0019F2FB2E|nr:histone deacetylase [Chlorogloeopsis fritschii]MBF2005548.1 histone deacetylase [Chlorogloeopsis fritschii C42_A2020_084]